MKAMWKDRVLAESNDTIVIEKNHYFPAASINHEYFSESDTTTECNWKGTARYYTITASNEINKDAAWYYASPMDAAKEITGYIAFWRGVEVVE